MAEILQLAGAQHITIPPILLKALAAEPYNSATFVNTSLFDVLVDVLIPSPSDFTGLLDEDETAFNTLLEAEDDGKVQQVFLLRQLDLRGFTELMRCEFKGNRHIHRDAPGADGTRGRKPTGL